MYSDKTRILRGMMEVSSCPQHTLEKHICSFQELERLPNCMSFPIFCQIFKCFNVLRSLVKKLQWFASQTNNDLFRRHFLSEMGVPILTSVLRQSYTISPTFYRCGGGTDGVAHSTEVSAIRWSWAVPPRIVSLTTWLHRICGHGNVINTVFAGNRISVFC